MRHALWLSALCLTAACTEPVDDDNNTPSVDLSVMDSIPVADLADFDAYQDYFQAQASTFDGVYYLQESEHVGPRGFVALGDVCGGADFYEEDFTTEGLDGAEKSVAESIVGWRDGTYGEEAHRGDLRIVGLWCDGPGEERIEKAFLFNTWEQWLGDKPEGAILALLAEQAKGTNYPFSDGIDRVPYVEDGMMFGRRVEGGVEVVLQEFGDCTAASRLVTALVGQDWAMEIRAEGAWDGSCE